MMGDSIFGVPGSGIHEYSVPQYKACNEDDDDYDGDLIYYKPDYNIHHIYYYMHMCLGEKWNVNTIF